MFLLVLLSQAFSEFENDIEELEGILREYNDPIYEGNQGDGPRDEL